MTISYIGIGSNLAQPIEQVKQAIENLADLPETSLLDASSLYASKPQGPQDQPDFVNAVAKVETQLSSLALLAALQQQELAQGKIKKRHWGERLIDLDIILFGDEVINLPELQIPHLEMVNRDFVLLPLQQIAPGIQIPNQANITTLIERLPEQFIFPIENLVNSPK